MKEEERSRMIKRDQLTKQEIIDRLQGRLTVVKRQIDDFEMKKAGLVLHTTSGKEKYARTQGVLRELRDEAQWLEHVLKYC
jgi:hypothetical protein